MNIGIVGSEAAKFTPETEAKAKELIAQLLANKEDSCVSGHCHLGGIDIWAEEFAYQNGNPTFIYPPKQRNWEGYKARNIQIALKSDIVHCITITKYPDSYKGMKFKMCYHCGTSSHVKSGGCWTAKVAKANGRKMEIHVI